MMTPPTERTAATSAATFSLSRPSEKFGTHSISLFAISDSPFRVQEGKARMDGKPDIGTIFPKRVQFTYPGPIVKWNRKGIVSQEGILFLCTSLLNLLNDEADNEGTDTPVIPMDLPSLEAFRMLFDLFSSKLDT
jgi:hypothetical protein